MSKQNIVVIDTGTGQEVENTDVRIEGTEGTLHMTEQTSTPATPSTGTQAIYPKNDDRMYHILDDGSELPIVSGPAFYALARFFDGTVIEAIDIDVIEDSGTVYLTLQASGGGDLTYQFAGEQYTLDCTPIQQLALTAGTDASPTENYVYVTESGGTLTLTKSTSGWPTSTPYSPVARVLVPSATLVASDGVYKLHGWTDHINYSDENGHLEHINAKLRSFPAGYESGVAPSDLVVSDPDAYISTTAGVIYQLHPQTFPAFDMGSGDPVYVTNHTTANFTPITSFDGIDEDASGNSVNNKYLNVVLLGVVSENQSDCKLFLNLPTGVYNNAADAQADISDYTVYSFPDNTVGTAFLIARYTLQGKTSGAWSQVEKVDLRGVTPSVAGFAGASITDHGSLTGLADDDHTQYALLAGRSTGQTLVGGTGASENLTLSPTSNATKGHVIIEGGQLSSADATFTGTQVMGLNAVASGDDGVVIGNSANVGPNGVVIGQGAAGGDGAVVIGQGSGNSGVQDAVIIGLTATGTDGSIALGLNADGSGGNVAIGSGAVADGTGAVAIGAGSDAGHSSSIAIGAGGALATTTAANQLVVGGITTAYLGDGVTDTSPNSMSVYGTGGSGANVQGADLTLAAGAGTGDAACGRFYIDYAPAGATGSTLNGYAQAFEIETDGDTRIYNDLQVDGNATVTGWVYPGDGVEIDTAAILSFNNGTHAAEAYPTGTELLIDGTGATMNSIGINDLDVVVKTGGVSVTAGDITATAGDIIATAGSVSADAGTVTGAQVGAGTASPASGIELHVVDGAGTLPAIGSSTQAIFQNNTNAGDFALISVIGGTTGGAGFQFGDSGDENAANFFYDNNANAFSARTNGGASSFGITSAGKVQAKLSFQVGSASATRWASVPIMGAVASSASLTANSSGLLWSVAAATAGDILFPVPSSVLGTEIKAVRVYYTTTAYSTPGSTINVGLYEANAGTNGLVTGASNSAAITSATSTTLTATATGVQSLGAGDQATVRVWISPSAGDVVIQITSVEVQYEEREY